MKTGTTAGVIALAIAAFAGGICAERLWFSSGKADPPVVAESPSSHPRQAAVSAAQTRPDEEVDSGSPARDEPSSVFELLDRMQGGEAFSFDDAVALFSRMPEGGDRRHAVERIASQWGRRDPAGALLWLETLSGFEANVALERIVREWAENDPVSAANYVAGLPKSDRQLEHVYHIAESWARRDRSAAVNWALGQDDVAVRSRALRGVAEVWAVDDPAAGAAFALTLESAFERRAVIEQFAGRWADSDRDAALDWAAGLSGIDRTHALQSVLNRVASDDPRRAARIYDEIVSQLPQATGPENLHRQVAREVAGRWSSNEPQAAARWAMTLPQDGEIRRSAVREVTEHWMRMDSHGASAWAVELPAGEVRDTAARVIADRTLSTDPESAFAWASSIGDEDHRNGFMHHVLEKWRESDPVAARAALDAADVSPSARRHLASVFPEPGPTAPAETVEPPNSP